MPARFNLSTRFVIYCDAPDGRLFASGDGHSPRHFSSEYPDAFKFDTRREAAEASQNFGPEWNVGSTDEV